MTTNFTIDDTSPDIVYSANWAAQTTADSSLDKFFETTYHSAQADGASANLTFTGAFAIGDGCAVLRGGH